MLRLALGAVAAFAGASVVAARSAITVAAVSAWAAVVAVAASFASGAPITITAASAAVTVTPAPMTVAAVAASAFTVAARFARGSGVGELLAGFLVDEAHRETHLAALVDLEQLDLHFLAFGENVAD